MGGRIIPDERKILKAQGILGPVLVLHLSQCLHMMNQKMCCHALAYCHIIQIEVHLELNHRLLIRKELSVSLPTSLFVPLFASLVLPFSVLGQWWGHNSQETALATSRSLTALRFRCPCGVQLTYSPIWSVSPQIWELCAWKKITPGIWPWTSQDSFMHIPVTLQFHFPPRKSKKKERKKNRLHSCSLIHTPLSIYMDVSCTDSEPDKVIVWGLTHPYW